MSLVAELRRRNVFKVAAAYVIVGWLILQIGDVLAPALHLPDWTDSFVAFIVILGFPVALLLAWAFELTPEGVKREREVEREESIAHVTGQKLNQLIIVLLLLALGWFAWDKWLRAPSLQPISAQAPVEAPGDAADTATASNAKSIAVLPFSNRSAGGENASFFSDGVHDELLTNLSRIGDLKVISRTSVMAYRDTDKNMRQIGDELDVSTLLEGAVQRAGDTVRINVQLIDADTDEHLWAEIYDRELTAENIFAIQSEIALAIAEALQAALSPAEQARLGEVPTQNLEAYDRYLLATQLNERANWASLEQALREAQRAIELDPNFAAAYTLRAELLGRLFATGARSLEDIEDEWRQAIELAMARNPNDGRALAALAALDWATGDWTKAKEITARALQMSPNDINILIQYASMAWRSGEPERALSLLERARELDPVSPTVWFNLARTHVMLGEYDEALEKLARIRAIEPSSSLGIGPVAGIEAQKGELAEALLWLSRALNADPDDLDLWNWAAWLYIDMGDFASAEAWLDDLPAGAEDYPLTLANRTRIDLLQGRLEPAAERARRFFDQGKGNRWGATEVMSQTLLIDALDRGEVEGAVNRIGQAFPELLDTEPRVYQENVRPALDLAHALRAAGRDPESRRLLDAIQAFVDQPYALAGDANGWRLSARAQLLALLGRSADAIDDLHSRVDNGWRLNWRMELLLNPNVDPLRDDPEFQAILDVLESEMADQREAARAMVANGDIQRPSGATP